MTETSDYQQYAQIVALKHFAEKDSVNQTKGFLTRELLKNNMKIEGILPDNNVISPSFRIVKS